MLKHKKWKYFIKFLWITTTFLQFVIHLFKHCDIYKSYRSLIQLLWNKVNTRDSKAIDNHPRCKNNGGTSLPFTCKTDLLIDFILLNGRFFFKLAIMNGLFLLSCLSSSLQFECFISLDRYFLRCAMILNLDCNSLQLLSLLISMFLDGYFEDCNLLLVACLNR